ncbi:hypothetical protein KIN20_013805 [Parelaphostrongylus tenuis]|uniref:Uncharacterized protein n=1 Tax=Parelaphostrongylus tenuis TaxID=148309 RepID=A0AAD5N2G7_PARTN|nr:hypothetical protein KIN20_013805 [Parelaphostrongylus tenuis]
MEVDKSFPRSTEPVADVSRKSRKQHSDVRARQGTKTIRGEDENEPFSKISLSENSERKPKKIIGALAEEEEVRAINHLRRELTGLFASKNNEFYERGIDSMPERWQICI